MIFRRVRLWLTLMLVLLFVILYAATSILIYGLTAQLTQSDIDSVLRATATPLQGEILHAFDRGNFPTQFVELADLSSLYPKVSVITLRDALGDVIANTSPGTVLPLPPSDRTVALATVAVLHSSAIYRVIDVPLFNPYHQMQGNLQVGLRINHDVAALGRLAKALVEAGIGGTVLAALAGFYMSRLSLRPVRRSWKTQQQFVADASHELRTPLAALQMNLEVLRGHMDETIADNVQWLDALARETARLSRLTDDLLTLARAESATQRLHVAEVRLPALIGRATERMRALAAAKGLELQVASSLAPGDDGQLTADEDRLEQLLTILIDNAIKYTATGSVTVSLDGDARVLNVSVQDTGIGIPERAQGEIFRRFYRVDSTRSTAAGGAGLGLAIARWIVDAHGGRIALRSVVGQGTVVSVTLRRRLRRGGRRGPAV